MPELPEVETIRVGLQKLLLDMQVVSANSDNLKSFPNDKHEVDNFLVGAKVIDIRRRAKVLMIDLSTNYTLVIHLKMTGQLVFVQQTKSTEYRVKSLESNSLNTKYKIQNTRPKPELRFGAGHPTDSLIGKLPDRSTRVTINFTDGSRLFFNDQRKFGWMRLMPTAEVPNIDFMKKVGPEPLTTNFTADVFAKCILRRKNSNIKAVLLDQTVLAGIGNIYADESLFLARIHPTSTVKDIPKKSIKKLHGDIKYVLKLSIQKGGSTDRNYVNAEGKRGSYIDFAKVFRKNGQPCPVCGTIITKIKVAGRGTHVCSNCQIVYGTLDLRKSPTTPEFFSEPSSTISSLSVSKDMLYPDNSTAKSLKNDPDNNAILRKSSIKK